MKPQLHYGYQRRGFTEAAVTVVEVLCIVALAAASAMALVVILSWGSHPGPRATAVPAQISAFASILESFRVDNGCYPAGTNGLQDLLRQPQVSTNWHGPYIKEVGKDPWDREYVYDCPGKHTESGYAYDLYSFGPPGENHPIANWMLETMKTSTNR